MSGANTAGLARWIGLSGHIASGKTTVACHLSRCYGYRYARYSQVLANMLESQGKAVNRRNLQEIGEEVNQTMGGAGLTGILVSGLADDSPAAIDGLRHLSDVEALKRHNPRFALVYMRASDSIRRHRYEVDWVEGAPSFDQACDHPVEREVALLEGCADVVFDNNDSLEALFAAIRSVLFAFDAAGSDVGC